MYTFLTNFLCYNEIMRDIEKYTNALSKAIDSELLRELPFGCVNLRSNGSHNDMDYNLFVISKNSIAKSLKNITWSNINDFNQLRKAGKKVEDQMFAATNSINTHKGLIFLHMFIAKAYVDGIKRKDFNYFIENLAKPLINDYQTMGKAKKWDNNGLCDIRTYPINGFVSLTNIVDQIYLQEISDLYLTIFLLATTDDTTTFQRSNIKTLRYVQKKASQILNTSTSKDFTKKAQDLSDYYINNNISSGGVADLFTTIRTLEYLREDFDD